MLNLTVAAILISAAWLGLIGWYIYLSRQQDELEQELEVLRQLLDAKEREEN